MLYAKHVLKIHFLIQKICGLNREGIGGENKLVTQHHYQLSRMVKSRSQAQGGSLVSHTLDRALP